MNPESSAQSGVANQAMNLSYVAPAASVAGAKWHVSYS